ncbi:MAG TPA: isoprenylcysteine carboxylmethyltransferase family protein [Pseudolabrys sp.]
MTHVLRALIAGLWILWLGYWIVAARNPRETRRREGFASQLTHYGPLILGGLLLGVPNMLGQDLERQFHAPTENWLWAASALVAIGLGFSGWARVRLGGNWSAEVTVKQNHELVRSGPYALVRHPIYTGVLLALAGTALSIDKWRALIGLLIIAAGFLRKIVIEERFMAAEFGEAYARYRDEVPALIPFLI